MAASQTSLPRWPIQRMALADLLPAPYNPRKMTAEQREHLRRSLARWGDANIITWNKRTGHTVGGHQRIEALLDLGEKEADVRVLDISLDEEKALNLALNNGGGWDEDKLVDVLRHLDATDTELLLHTGFEKDVLTTLLGTPNEPVVGLLTEAPEDEPPKLECPKCHHKFTPKDGRKRRGGKR